MTKQEDGQINSLGVWSVVLLTDHRVWFILPNERGQWWGLCMCLSNTESRREKRSCADDKNEPELSSLCRTGESDALF